MKLTIRLWATLTLAAALIASLGGAAAYASADVEIVDAFWQPDEPFPQFSQFWTDGNLPADASKLKLGGAVCVYIRNSGDQPIAINDVLLDGISLKQAIAPSDKRKFKKTILAANIHFSNLSVSDRDKLVALGEPVWWRAEPESVAPSAAAEVYVRLRRAPGSPLDLILQTSGGPIRVRVFMTAPRPRIESISFSRALDAAYVYVRHPNAGPVPIKVLVDGADITASADIAHDPSMTVTPIVCRFAAALARASYHTFHVVYSDGSRAIAGICAFSDDLTYGMWGARPGPETDLSIGRAHIEDMALHNLNLQMEVIGSDAVRKFMSSPDGRKLLETLGIRQIVGEPEKAVLPPFAYYLADEPDAADYRVQGVPERSKVGSLATGLVARARDLRNAHPEVPNMLNVDMTFKPDNWYIYGRLPDIFAADPYYQTRLCQAYWQKPDTIPIYSKATFVYAVGSVCRSACAPNPLHLMLNCTKIRKGNRCFRFATPAEKRIELYYALAAGAKSISYWWFIPLKPGASGSSGCGADEPDAKALWNEIGLLGAEVRTLDELISRSCPAEVAIDAPDKLWVRTLLAGSDSLVVLCVNDDYVCNDKGTVINPVRNAVLTVTLPVWLDAKSVFEFDYRGPCDVKHELTVSKLKLDLGTVETTRLIVVSADAHLRDRLQKLYDAKYAANVAKLLARRGTSSGN